MPNNRSNRSDQSNLMPSEDFDAMVNDLIKDPSLKKGTRPIKKINVLPGQQSSVPLGRYTRLHRPKGFCVEIDPDPYPDHSVVTRVLSVGDPAEYTLTMVVANFGSKEITAKIWRL